MSSREIRSRSRSGRILGNVMGPCVLPTWHRIWGPRLVSAGGQRDPPDLAVSIQEELAGSGLAHATGSQGSAKARPLCAVPPTVVLPG